MNNLPHFLGIGAQKAGTTWLYSQLKQHPSIFMPAKKELRFFFDANQPVEWYYDQFKPALADQLCGEITPEYMIRREAASQIAELLPEVKLICLLRKPTERAFSQWCMARKLGNIPNDTPFLKAFQQNLQFVRERGHYVEHLETYSNYFPASRLKVFFYDDLIRDPHRLWREVLRFLGVDDAFVPADLLAPVNRRESDKQLSEEDRAVIAQYYAPWNHRLSQFLGQKLDDWND